MIELILTITIGFNVAVIPVESCDNAVMLSVLIEHQLSEWDMNSVSVDVTCYERIDDPVTIVKNM